jgi:ATP-dependent Zn protease
VVRRGEDVSDETEMVIDTEVRSILREAHEKAGGILTDHREQLDALATLLLERETLERPDLEHHLGARRGPSPFPGKDGRPASRPALRPVTGRAAGEGDR